ncbi:hypothetical protein OF83DRAFT_826548 [Amylostereum chailletii]|nr:hypothetical protein OF83DRAFT_826548 [Amylostereum chailletii]
MPTLTISEASFGDSDVFEDDVASLSSTTISEGAIHRPATSPRTASASGHDTCGLAHDSHSRFYFEDGTVTFLVEGAAYRIHRYFLTRDSLYFRKLFEHTDFAGPIELKGTTKVDLDAFLSVLYPLDFQRCEVTTVTGWASVLRLATRWNFASIRALAIERLESLASPVDKLVLSHAFNVPHWLLPSYIALCLREASPSREECSRLQMDDVVLVFSVREAVIGSGTTGNADEVSRRVVQEMGRLSACGSPCAPPQEQEASSNIAEELLEGVTEETVDAISLRVLLWANKPPHKRFKYTRRDLVLNIMGVCARSQSPAYSTIARRVLDRLLNDISPDVQDADSKLKGRALIASYLREATEAAFSQYLHTVSSPRIFTASDAEKTDARQAMMIVVELLKTGVISPDIAYDAVNRGFQQAGLVEMCGLLQIVWPVTALNTIQTMVWKSTLRNTKVVDGHTRGLVKDLLDRHSRNWVA